MKHNYFKVACVKSTLSWFFVCAFLIMGNLNAQQTKNSKKLFHSLSYEDPWQKGGSFEGFNPRQEIKGKRTQNSKHFKNDDGTFTAQIGLDYHYQDAKGNWQEIDLRLTKSNKSQYEYANETNLIKSYFPKNPGQTAILMDLGKGAKFYWWQNPSMSIIKNGVENKVIKAQFAETYTENSGLVYWEIYPNISEEFEVKTKGLKSNTIIHNLSPELASLGHDDKIEFNQFIPLYSGYEVLVNGKKKSNNFEFEEFFIKIPGSEEGIYFGNIVIYDNRVDANEALALVHSPENKLHPTQKNY